MSVALGNRGRRTGANAAQELGYTLIELMVSITIGLLLLAGLATLFANNSRTRNEIERANQQTENGRYALQILTDDLHNAGYFAEFNPGTVASTDPQLATEIPATVPDPCATDFASLNSGVAMPVQGVYQAGGGTIPSCLPADVKAGTDILVVRRASTCAVGAAGCDAYVAGAFYFQASTCPTELASANDFVLDSNTANLTLHQPSIAGGCPTVAPWHQYRVSIYFVANNDNVGDGIPTLKKAQLGAGGFTIVPLVDGIENLQIEYGLDGLNTSNPTTGSPQAYTADPTNFAGCAPAACTAVGNWRNTVATKIHLLARNTTTTPGYTDNKTYTLGFRSDGVTPYTVGHFGDGYKRHLFESVVRLNNIAGRNSP